MEKYKRLNKIEFLFYGLATGFYFGGQTNGKTIMIFVFFLCVLVAVIGFFLDKREIKNSAQSSRHIE